MILGRYPHIRVAWLLGRRTVDKIMRVIEAERRSSKGQITTYIVSWWQRLPRSACPAQLTRRFQILGGEGTFLERTSAGFRSTSLYDAYSCRPGLPILRHPISERWTERRAKKARSPHGEMRASCCVFFRGRGGTPNSVTCCPSLSGLAVKTRCVGPSSWHAIYIYPSTVRTFGYAPVGHGAQTSANFTKAAERC